MEDDSIYEEGRISIDKINAASQKFLTTVQSCMASGRALVEGGQMIAATWNELQLARQENELKYKRFLELSDRGLKKFSDVLPIISQNLKFRLNMINDTREKLMNMNYDYSSPHQLESRNIMLKILEREPQAYFAELDRLLNL